jgi:hypothetical protein
MANRSQMYVAYNITTREGGKSFWNRCGVAWVNRDGSINIKLELLPLDGNLQLRLPEEKERDSASNEGSR